MPRTAANLAAAEALGGVGGAGALATGGNAVAFTDFIGALDNAAVGRALQIGLGNGVSLVATTNAGTLVLVADTSFTAVSKHLRGNTYYGTDGDVSLFYVDAVAGSEGVILTTGYEPASVPGADDFDSIGNWVVK